MSSKSKSKKRKSRGSRDSSDGEEEQVSETIDYKVIKRNGALKHDFHRLCTSDDFVHPELLANVKPQDFNLEYFEKNGLTKPILFKCKPEELGMMMPDPEKFSEDNVMEMVGGKRFVEVVVVDDQSGRSVPLESMIDYYKNPEGRELTNMLSLEFSLTKMRDIVSGPSVLNEIDWVSKYWPDELYTRSVNFTVKSNYSFNVNYPAVQRFCLMGTPGCYTDFHLDFGGTSVWYHVLHGKKIFFLVEPTEQNLLMYDQWQRNYDLSGWFGDIVEKCARMEINAGETAILPSGWIHAVYTPVKSLVFGGNYLHSYSATMQCKVQNLEGKLRISAKYRYPFFEELHFFLVAKIVEECTGRQYVRPIERTKNLEYIGREWLKSGGHRIPILWENYSKMLAARKKALKDEKEVLFEIPNDPMAFYDAPVERTDKLRTKCSAHKDLHTPEPDIIWREDGVKKITQRLLREYESILEYLWSKKSVDVPDQITRPASLLYCFQTILCERRTALETEGIDLPPPPPNIYFVPQMRVLPSEPINHPNPIKVPEPDSPISSRSEELGYFEDEFTTNLSELNNSNAESNFYSAMVEKMETDHEQVDDKHANSKEEIEEEVKEEIQEEIKEEIKEEIAEDADENTTEEHDDENGDENNETSLDMTDDVEDKEVNSSKSGKRGRKKKETKSNKAPASKNKKTLADRKRKERASFEDAFAPKPKKKQNPKKNKPEFVGGIPVTPIQSGPAVPNAYNYDPMQEIMKLGTGQLQSTYRKSQFNIAPPKEKKIYKLEHKPSVEKEEPEEDVQQPLSATIPDNRLPRLSGGPFTQDNNFSPTKPFPVEMYSPTVPLNDHERRFSTGSSDRFERSTEAGYRNRTKSFDTSKLGGSPSLTPSKPPSTLPDWKSYSLGAEETPVNPPEKQQHDVGVFLRRAKELVDKLKILNQVRKKVD